MVKERLNLSTNVSHGGSNLSSRGSLRLLSFSNLGNPGFWRLSRGTVSFLLAVPELLFVASRSFAGRTD